MIVSRSAFALLQGEPRTYELRLPDGRPWRGRFCGTCATRLWGEPLKFPQVVTIRPGTLDDTSWLRPVAHIWTRSAQPWVAIPDDALNFATQPDDPLALINAWHDRRLRRRSCAAPAG